MSIDNIVMQNGHVKKRRKLSHSSEPDAVVTKPIISETGQQSSIIHDSIHESRKSRVSNGQNHARPVTVSSKLNSASSLSSQAQILIRELDLDHDSLLKQARPSIDKIIKSIKSISQHGPISLAEAQSFSQKTLKVTIPWNPRPKSDIKYNFGFQPPSKIEIGGTLAVGIGRKDDMIIVLSPVMPNDLFQEKDYLNHRALHKRAFYLACITSTLQKDFGTAFRLEFASAEGNSLCPVLVFHSKTDDITIIVSPSFPDSLGPINKTTPSHVNIRKYTSQDGVPTPLYNSTIRWLASATIYNDLIQQACQKADQFKDACLLGSNWLQKRGFSSTCSQGGFGITEWAIICALLLESGGHQGKPLFSPRYNAVQLWKAMMQVLGNRDMFHPFVVRGDIQLESNGIPILYDAETGVNLFYKMQRWSYSRLKTLASQSLTASNSKDNSIFSTIFTSRVSVNCLAFDEVYEITNSTGNDELDMVRVYHTFKTGLMNRVTTIDIQQDPIKPWKITSSPSSTIAKKFILSLLVIAENASRLIDHGPSVEEKEEAEQFRNFWGEKAELRKFKDGRISETLTWTAETPVTQQIVEYVSRRHLRLSPDTIQSPLTLVKRQLESKLSAQEAFSAINMKIQDLSNTLHHLDGLPLPIRSVSASSDQLRSSSILLPFSDTIQPVNITIQFDTSGRWPDNLPAIQYTKIAFLTKLGDLLAAQDKMWEVKVGLENTLTSSKGTQNTSFLDIIQPSQSPAIPPLVFRLRIYHERELQLIQTALASKSLELTDRDLFQSSLQAQKQSTASIAHTNAIRTLITAFPPLSETIRLLKRFISAHHLTNHFPDEIVEIIAAKIFLNPQPWFVPGTSNTAFLRCLNFLSHWNWSAEPLIVDLSLGQDMTMEQRSELDSRYQAWRKMDPNMNTVAWFVGTNLDNTGVIWTQGAGSVQQHPSRVIASRLTTLTKAAIDLVSSQSSTLTADVLDSIFVSSLDDFDFVLHLKSNKKKSKTTFKNLELANTLQVDTSGVDVISEYVADLTGSFGSVALFFSGKETNVICGLWRPHIRGDKPWKIRLGYSTIPLPIETDEAHCKVNFMSMLAEIGSIGEGIVERIAIKEM